jgi:2-oxoacid dehydrogenases acyltransferase (catalytic domain)
VTTVATPGTDAHGRHSGSPAPLRGDVRVARLSRGHLLVLDLLRLAARQPTIHGLIEVDVSVARQRMRSCDERPTMTGFVVATVARAIRDCPEVNVRRAGRNAVHFAAVDLAVTVERLVDGDLCPMPFVVRDADHKAVTEITAELRADRTAPLDRPQEAAGRSLLAVLPPVVRRVGAVMLGRLPHAAARFGPPSVSRHWACSAPDGGSRCHR